VRRLAAEIRGGSDDFCRVDMGSLAQEHYAASFAGAPPGYAGSKEGFSVFDRDLVEGDAYRPGIVLFDEVEKAHPVVLRALLQVLDRGILRLSNGQQTINFRNSLVFLTSNLGSREIADRQLRRSREVPGLLRRARESVSRAATSAVGEDEATVRISVENFFDPEFLNRIDETVVFREISGQSAVEIAALELRLLQQRLRREQVTLHVGPTVAQTVCALGYDATYGARSLRRTIQRHVLPDLADALGRARGQQRRPVTVRLEAQARGFMAVVQDDVADANAAS
jgi:ATP-dependent Clp protease ATP-binding subunit ClpA